MKVKLTITESNCRGGYFKAGEEFIVEDLCLPLQFTAIKQRAGVFDFEYFSNPHLNEKHIHRSES